MTVNNGCIIWCLETHSSLLLSNFVQMPSKIRIKGCSSFYLVIFPWILCSLESKFFSFSYSCTLINILHFVSA